MRLLSLFEKQFRERLPHLGQPLNQNSVFFLREPWVLDNPGEFEMLKPFADELVCLGTPVSFMTVGNRYTDFEQVSDEEVVAVLHRNWARVRLSEVARA